MERFSGAVNVVHNYLLTRYGIDVLHAVLRHKLGKTTESAFRSEVAGKNVKWGGEAMKRIANRLRMRFVATYPEFLGEDRSSRYIIVPNHVSMMDVYAICAYMGQISHTNLRWIMAAHVRKFPFIGKGAELQGSAFVSRKGRPEDRAALERCARVVLEDDADVVIFPEGKRCSRERVKSFSSPYRHLLPPRRNGLKILKECLPDHKLLSVTIAHVDSSLAPDGVLGQKDFFGCTFAVNASVHDVQVSEIDDWLDAEWLKKDAELEEFYGSTSDIDLPQRLCSRNRVIRPNLDAAFYQ